MPEGGIQHPCKLPGSIQFTANGTVVVPGGSSSADLSFLHLPEGFCAHYFATIPNTRQLRFAPGGELFVASPTGLTTGGGPGGQSAIIVLADDDHDGYADAPTTFLGNLPKTQGLMFTPGFFYYQDDTKIMRAPYQPGDRSPSGASEQVANITYYSSSLHWPKAMDIADDGSIYVANGGDQGETCVFPHPFHGGIRKIDGTPDGAPIAQGFRNPIAVRCQKGHNKCFALELAKDYTATSGGREKLIPIRKGDDWGFPCCATKNTPYTDVPPTDCSDVVPEAVGFYIGDTPFGLDFAPASWPAPYGGSAMVGNHGAAGSYVGARVVSIGMDPSTGLPLPGGNVNGQNTGSMKDFATGWDDGTLQHGRPAAVELSADGRMFIGNDTNGVIFWIAPID
jgi:glucose/arabinose dehydrogenase